MEELTAKQRASYEGVQKYLEQNPGASKMEAIRKTGTNTFTYNVAKQKVDVVCHLKVPGEGRLDLRVISMIPRFFDGKEIQYNKALEQVLKKDLG